MTGGKGGNENVGGLGPRCIVVHLIVRHFHAILIHQAQGMEHHGLVPHQGIQMARDGDLLDFPLILPFSKLAPKRVKGQFRRGFTAFVLLDP